MSIQELYNCGVIMAPEIKQIARRIQELRDIEGVSHETLARELEIQPELYLKYESGETDIPVSVLLKIAQRFDVELTALITGEEPKLKVFSVVRKGKGLSIDRRKEYKYQDLAYNFIHKKAEVLMVTVDPQDDNPKGQYSHAGQEYNYVVEGSLKVWIDGHELVLNEGDSVYFDSSYKHGMCALNGKNARFLAIII